MSFSLHELIKDFRKYFEGKDYLFNRFVFSEMKDYTVKPLFKRTPSRVPKSN